MIVDLRIRQRISLTLEMQASLRVHYSLQASSRLNMIGRRGKLLIQSRSCVIDDPEGEHGEGIVYSTLLRAFTT